jgi:hypothetical protein
MIRMISFARRAFLCSGVAAGTGYLMRASSLPKAMQGSLAAVPRLADFHGLPTFDLSADTAKQSVVAAGTPEIYQGHPTTLLCADGRTIYCVWTIGHGGPCGPMKRSRDGGRSWSHLLPVPANWTTVRNCPAIYRLVAPGGKARVFVFAGAGPDGGMYYACSDDDCKTWTPMQPTHLSPSVMPFCSILSVHGGAELLGMTNIRRPGDSSDPRSNVLAQSRSRDGGTTWSPWRIVLDLVGLMPCEPAMVRSPDGRQILCLIRENVRHEALYMTSEDEGNTWSAVNKLPPGLWGDRHMPRYTHDRRLVVTFRDSALESPTHNHFVVWVGHYEDILKGARGQYRIKLLESYSKGDCGYSGLEVLPDNTLAATTYIKYRPGPDKNSVVCVRFRLEEIDRLLRKPAVAS